MSSAKQWLTLRLAYAAQRELLDRPADASGAWACKSLPTGKLNLCDASHQWYRNADWVNLTPMQAGGCAVPSRSGSPR